MPYDLTREPWIPVRWCSGETGAPAVGLREALAEAHRIAEVTTADPLQTAALYRLLQALFLRLHPETHEPDAWWGCWHRGRFDPERPTRYFDEWQDRSGRFELLHATHPFCGHPAPPQPNEGPLSWLFHERARGNNATLFDHTLDADNPGVGLDEAARALLAAHAYGLGGLAGGGRPGYREGHLVSGIVFWIRGESLFHALLLNTPPLTGARIHPPDASQPTDVPTWERNDEPDDAIRPERGYLDFLTWPGRRIRLIPDDPERPTRIVNVHLSRGAKWESPSRDPLMALRTSPKGEQYPFKFQPGKALWRDLHVLLGTQGNGRPPTFDWLVDPDFADEAGTAAPWQVDAFGLANDQAKVELTRHERVPVHPALLRSAMLQSLLSDALKRAQDQRNLLRDACRTCAAHLATDNDRGPVAEALRADDRYWARAGAEFFPWLDGLAALDPGDDEAGGVHLARWTKTLFDIACAVYDEATEAFCLTPRQLEAVARGHNRLRPAAAYRDRLAEAPRSTQPANP